MNRIASSLCRSLIIAASLAVVLEVTARDTEELIVSHTEQGHTVQDWFIDLGKSRDGNVYLLLDDDGYPAEVAVYDGPCWFIVMETCSGSRVLMPEEMMAQWSWWSEQCNGLVACKGEEPYVWMEVTDMEPDGGFIPCEPVIAVRPRRSAADFPAQRIPAPCEPDYSHPCGRVRIINSDVPPDAPGPYVPPFQFDPLKLGCVCDPCEEED